MNEETKKNAPEQSCDAPGTSGTRTGGGAIKYELKDVPDVFQRVIENNLNIRRNAATAAATAAKKK